jgi:dihydroorotate dehydrogenase (fumarate)
MVDLTTKYMGLKLKNPIIAGASNLVDNLDNIRKMEEAGAAAIVYKTLFEEEIELERLQLSEELNEYTERHAEMITLFPNLEHSGPAAHLENLRRAAQAVSIPVIASLNCTFEDTWIDYSKMIEQTGVNAIELNFYAIPGDFKKEEKAIIAEQLDVLSHVRKNIKIPVSVKLSPFYTNVLSLIQRMFFEGVDGFVLFNRLFQPDIDVEKEEHYFPYNLSHEEDSRMALRYIGLLCGEIRGSLCANTGIFSGRDVIKMLLAGADAVQVVSTLYKSGFTQIPKMLNEISEWMDMKGYSTIDGFKGKLSRKNIKDPFVYKRAQYVDILLKSEEIFKRYPMR